MTANTLSETDELVRYSRRSLWTALVLILLLGVPGAFSLGFPDSEMGALLKRFASALPVGIILAVVALRSSISRARLNPSGAAMRAIRNDELRAASMHRAYRNACIGMMVLQPVLAIWLTHIAMADPLAFSACVTVLSGAALLLASILFYDR
ncbi:MAG: hypothetical protein ABWY27_05175 [Telluria sp.]